MLNLGFLAFAQPLLLLALVILPLLWLLLRVTPPAPRRQRFPAIVLLTGLKPPQETSDKTPWWLVLLRNLAVACLILGLAHPLLSPDRQLAGSGPLALVIDDGWSAAHDWGQRVSTGLRLIGQAEREDRSVLLLTTAPRRGEDLALTPLPATEARSLLRKLKPQPWPSDRADALTRLEALSFPTSLKVAWLSDGLAEQGPSGEDQTLGDADFAKALQRLGSLEVYRDPANGTAKLLLPPETDGSDLILRLERAQSGPVEVEEVLIIDSENQVLDSMVLEFEPGDRIASGPITLPQQLRNRIAQLRLGGEKTAGAVFLMDERWRRRPSGIATSSGTDDPQPLLSETYYLKRALEPFSDLQLDSLETLLEQEMSLLALPDGVGTLDPAIEARLNGWISDGGVLVRFAGPRLAANAEGPIPVALRGQDRVLGGSLTWDEPVHLAPFAPESPFAGLAVPEDILIRRQVLAEPSLELLQKTWATLSDGTPLVTAERRDNGWIVLFHVSSNTEWSNLPLSGLFVSMLQRLAEVGQGVVSRDAEMPLQPQALLDGFGALGGTGELSEAVSLASLKEVGSVSSRQPPGYYGGEGLRVTHNLGGDLPPLDLLPTFGAAVGESLYGSSEEKPLGPWLLAAAMAMLLLDFLLSLWLRGHLSPRAPQGAGSGAAALLLAVLTVGIPGGARAQSDFGSADIRELKAIGATSVTSLGYVVTNRSEVDSISAAGLAGLIRILHFRTSIEAGAPLPVDIEQDELAFYPLLYWPILRDSEPLSAKAKGKLQDFLDNGGTVLFDLRDPSATARITGQVGGPEAALRRLLDGIEVPPLAPIPPDHVLTKSFYLMQEFPGRFAGGRVWVEAEEGNDHDGVTSVIIGANDWASAWAVDGYGRPISTVVPGGERQRELAYRFGVNLVMYALTGNYKADQVHVPYILERLGQ